MSVLTDSERKMKKDLSEKKSHLSTFQNKIRQVFSICKMIIFFLFLILLFQDKSRFGFKF